jgi:hypothetical protein
MTADRFIEVRVLLHKLALVREELHDPQARGDWCNGLTVAGCGLMHEERAMKAELKGESEAKRFPLGRPPMAALLLLFTIGCATAKPRDVAALQRQQDAIVQQSLVSRDSLSRGATLIKHEPGRWIEADSIARRYWLERWWYESEDGAMRWLVESSNGTWRIFDPLDKGLAP